MNFGDWQALAPREAAAELTRRLAALPRSVVARIPRLAELERRFEEAPKGSPLSGVPVLVKDMYDVAGEPTFAGSTFLPEVRPVGGDGAFVAALKRAGTVMGGKAQMVEFAYGLTGENAHYGDCSHPKDAGRTSGGSSSGSAHAVGKGAVPFATASDTGGSARLPAAFCGVYGMRLTPHHPWIEDAVPLAPSFDAPGWFTSTAEDMRTALRALLGQIPETNETALRARSGRPENQGVGQPAGVGPLRRRQAAHAKASTLARSAAAATDNGARGGRPGQGGYLLLGQVSPEVDRAFGAAAAKVATEISGPLQQELLAAFADAPQAYYGISASEAWNAHAPWFERYRDRYGATTRARLERALTVSEAERASALLARERIEQAFKLAFAAYDFLLLPASPFAAQTPAEFTPENRDRILALTTPAAVAGLPVMTIPVPLPTGLTTGLQVVVPTATSPSLDALLGL